MSHFFLLSRFSHCLCLLTLLQGLGVDLTEFIVFWVSLSFLDMWVFIRYGMFLATNSSNVFSTSPSGTPITCMLVCLMVSHHLWSSACSSLFFPLNFWACIISLQVYSSSWGLLWAPWVSFPFYLLLCSYWWLSGKESACNAGDLGSIPGLGRAPGGEYGHPLQCSCLENPMDRGGLQSTGSQRVGHDWVIGHMHCAVH